MRYHFDLSTDQDSTQDQNLKLADHKWLRKWAVQLSMRGDS